MSRKLPLDEGETSRTACARALIRSGVDERTGEIIPAAVLTERIGWCLDLVSGMAGRLIAERWNLPDVGSLASGEDATGRSLPSNAWMALRRLGWAVAPPDGVQVNDRIVRMAQEQAGRALRSVKWRADLVTGVLAAWPADPKERTGEEWDAVRGAVPGGEHLPSSIIRSRTRQITAFARSNGRLPADVFELEPTPRVPRMLLLAACDGQQATIERADDGQRALLRLQLPTRPDPQAYRDWTWVACPLTLPPTVPADAVLHLPTLRIAGGRVRADLAYTHPVPKTRRTGHTVALGVDWGLNTLLSAGAARLHDDGRITTLGTGAQFRAAGVLARQYRLRRISEHLHAKTNHYTRLADPALEAGGMGRTHNTRLSQTVRGQIADRMRHLAAEVGIAVVTVPPRRSRKLNPTQDRLADQRHCLHDSYRRACRRPRDPPYGLRACRV